MMPNKDGIQALQELQDLPDNPNADTPKICLTANAITGMRETYLAAGFDDYLTKPIEPDSLENSIIHFLPKEKIVNSAADSVQLDEKLPDDLYQIAGLNVEVGLKNMGTAESYLEALTAYAETCERAADEIDRFWQNQELENTIIKIHALKSSSKLIGAIDLGFLAGTLEQAGKEKKVEIISANITKLVADYRRLGQSLLPFVRPGIQDDSDKKELSTEQLKSVYTSLLKHVEAFDYDQIEELARPLFECKVPVEEMERVTKITQAIADFDYDKISELLSS